MVCLFLSQPELNLVNEGFFLSRLGANAFHKVLSRKQELYHEVVNDLSKRISGSEYKTFKREFGATVRDGLAEFKNIGF